MIEFNDLTRDSGGRLPLGINPSGDAGVGCSAFAAEFIEAASNVAGGEERPISSERQTPGEFINVGGEENHEAVLPRECEIGRGNQHPATGGDELMIPVAELLQKLAFALAEVRFSLLRENTRDRQSFILLDSLVGINEVAAKCPRGDLAGGGLADAGHAGQKDVPSVNVD